jgi:drug/metabolite transporter (DMT)-like permease
LIYLIVTSLIWALSFGLIKTFLTGFDPLVVAAVRLGLALLAFSPWLRLSGVGGGRAVRCMGLGAVQFGLMYWLYITAYQYLPAYAVAVFTIFTPLYVVLIESIWSRRWSWRFLLAALLAVGGALIIVFRTFDTPAALTGIVLLQAANLCFAVGQLGFRRLAGREGATEARLIAWMYLGAALFTGVAALLLADFGRFRLEWEPALVLLYLGLIPTGVGFFLWNKGAARTGPGALAAANNLKIPLGVLAAWLIFGEQADYLRVLAGLAVILVALFVSRDRSPAR